MEIRKFVLGFTLLFGSTLLANNNDTLMTIGNKVVLLDEFEYIYNKNNNSDVVEKSTLEESINMFVNYKLKVIDAEAKGLDTIKSFVDEYNGYKKQLAKPYLTDNKMLEDRYHEAYEHLKEDVDVSHILITIPKNATKKDRDAIYNRVLAVAERVKKEDFETVAREESEDVSVKENGGRLGYIAALSVVWSFEEAMYSLPIGEISEPILTNYGYHLIKVHDRRPAMGKVRASHIMKASNEKMTKEQQENAYNSIIIIYNKLVEGADFADLAKRESEDKGSAAKGGDLSWFGIGRMVKPFEDAAFAMQKNEFSKPIKTHFGWHIIKVTDKKGLESYEAKKNDIQKALQYVRLSEKAEEAFLDKLKKEYNFYQNVTSLRTLEDLMTEHGDNDSIILVKAEDYQDVVLSFKDNVIQGKEFVIYCLKNDIKKNINREFLKFAEEKFLDYEYSQLEKKYPEFRLLMSEYYGGLLLFEVSSREVWDKPLKDTKGLERFFKKNKKNYAWDSPRYKGVVVKAKNEEIANEVLDLCDKISLDSLNKHIKKITQSEEQQFIIERGLWKHGENDVVDALVFKKSDTPLENIENLPIVKVKGKLQKKLPASYLDVRGAVTSDYQDFLEKQWIDSLREKYPVVINEKYLEHLKDSSKNTSI